MTKISFCGISGSGMSALAQIRLHQGYEVRGSDRSFDQGKDQSNKQALEKLGIKIYPQDGSAITDDLDVLYVSTAVEDTIPDVKAALGKNIPIRKRSDLLADIFHGYGHNIAVGGTSGKTTVTAMIGYILDRLGQKPCMIDGGLLLNYADREGIPNIIYNEGDICVIEADESDGSIEKYHPYVALINNISIDHKPIPELQKLFQDFADRAKQGVVVNADCEACRNIRHPRKKTLTFSIETNKADFWAYNIEALPHGTKYSMDGKSFTLNLIGRFNVSNALAAIAACSLLGIDKFDAAQALEGFLGTHRPLDVVGTRTYIPVIDDFAHNPDKVKASVSALKNYPGRLIMMFQPHGFSPMRMMGRQIIDEFCAQMSDEDILLMPEIYFAGGTVTRDISSRDLISRAVENGKQARYFDNREAAGEFILANARPGDRIVIMGARDNSLPGFCQTILERLK